MTQTRVIYSDQYSLPCISVEDRGLIAFEDLIAQCHAAGAIRQDDPDGPEYVVELRADVGPELWTESALRRSVGKKLAVPQ